MPIDTPGIPAVTRPPGTQNDHATAFALIKKSLLSKGIDFTEEKPTFHITPVARKMIEDAKREIEVLKRSGVINLESLYEELLGDVPKTIAQNEPSKSKELIEMISKYTPKDNKFFMVYKKVVPYVNLLALVESLEGKITVTRNKARETEKQTKSIAAEIKVTQEDELERVAKKIFDYEKNDFNQSTWQDFVNINVDLLNKLPYAVFKQGFSGGNRFGGGAVTSAMKKLKETCSNDSPEPERAAIYMALLLDFHPLTKIQLEQQEKEEKKIIAEKNTFQESKATRIALLRNNDSLVFSYVVAKHWQIMHDTFEELSNCTEDVKAKIKDAFINHMLTRWKIAGEVNVGQNTNQKNFDDTESYAKEKGEIKEKLTLLQEGTEVKLAQNLELTDIDKDECKSKINEIINEYEVYTNLSPLSSRAISVRSTNISPEIPNEEQHKKLMEGYISVIQLALNSNMDLQNVAKMSQLGLNLHETIYFRSLFAEDGNSYHQDKAKTVFNSIVDEIGSKHEADTIYKFLKNPFFAGKHISALFENLNENVLENNSKQNPITPLKDSKPRSPSKSTTDSGEPVSKKTRTEQTPNFSDEGGFGTPSTNTKFTGQ